MSQRRRADFSCIPLTVTNQQGATLELDSDCALSYNPPSTTSSTTSSAAHGGALEASGSVLYTFADGYGDDHLNDDCH